MLLKEPFLRPCYVENIGKALFHLWEQYNEPVAGGVTIGSHPAGVLSYIMGIIEDENGQIHRVFPEKIKFVDREIKKYDFQEGLEEI